MADKILGEIRGNCIRIFAGCVLVQNRVHQLVDAGLIPLLVHVIGECIEGAITQEELQDAVIALSRIADHEKSRHAMWDQGGQVALDKIARTCKDDVIVSNAVHGLSKMTPVDNLAIGGEVEVEGGYGRDGKQKKPQHSNSNNMALTLAERQYMIDEPSLD
jgi:hypothetical protein